MADNRRNARIIGRNVKDIPYDQKTVYRTMKPMDFLVWSILEAKVSGKIYRDVDDLKRSLLRAWQEIPQKRLHASAESVCKR